MLVACKIQLQVQWKFEKHNKGNPAIPMKHHPLIRTYKVKLPREVSTNLDPELFDADE